MDSKKCKYCNNLLKEKGNIKFCSVKCSSKWRSIVGTSKSSCLTCGKEFTHRRSRDRKYCSKNCYYSSIRSDLPAMLCGGCGMEVKNRQSLSRALKKGHKAYCNKCKTYNAKTKKSVELSCETCGKIFKRKKSKINKRSFCSRKCMNNAKNVPKRGKIYPNTSKLRNKIQSRNAGIRSRLASKFDLGYKDVPENIVEISIAVTKSKEIISKKKEV